MGQPEQDGNGGQSVQVLERIKDLEKDQAVQAATHAGTQATQAATQAGATATQAAMEAGQAATAGASIAGLGATVAAGSVALIVGIFLGMAIRSHRHR